MAHRCFTFPCITHFTTDVISSQTIWDCLPQHGWHLSLLLSACSKQYLPTLCLQEPDIYSPAEQRYISALHFTSSQSTQSDCSLAANTSADGKEGKPKSSVRRNHSSATQMPSGELSSPPPPPCLGKIPSPHSHCRRTQHPWIKASGDSMATYSCPQLKGRNLKPTSAWEPNLTSWEKRNCKGYLAAKINPRCSRFGGVGWWSLQAWSRKDGTSSPTAWQQAGQRWDAEERAALKQNEMLKIEK